MPKYLKRLNARLARQTLRESKNWIVSKKLILEADDFDMELEKGETVELGATPEGDLAVKSHAAVVIISDEDLASQVANIIVNSDELSDVEFVQKDSLDAILDGEETEEVIDSLANDLDADSDEIEIGEMDIEQKESVAAKFEKISENVINPKVKNLCESILIDEEDNSGINIRTVKTMGVAKEAVTDYADFARLVTESKGSIKLGERELVLNESGKVVGFFDKDASVGTLFLENEFETEEAMNAFQDEQAPIVSDLALEVPAEGEEVITAEDAIAEIDAILNKTDVSGQTEEILGRYEESEQTGSDYSEMLDGLEDLGLEESVIGKIVSTFENRSLKEGVKVFDTKYGKHVASFKESVEADQFMTDTGSEKRFTKRFF